MLFLIAEQPPADMAALLALFKSSIPPVVKRRAKELLTVIKDAVKRGMAMARVGGSQVEPPEDGTAMVESTATTITTTAVVESRQDVVMLDAEMKDLEKVEVVESVKKVESASIWGRGRQKFLYYPVSSYVSMRCLSLPHWRIGLANAPSTPQSSLFGVSVSKAATTMNKTPALTASNVASGGLSTSVSTLFGSSTKSNIHVRETCCSFGWMFIKAKISQFQVPSPNLSNAAITHAVHPRFEELVAKINRSLTMAPSLPKVCHASVQQFCGY